MSALSVPAAPLPAPVNTGTPPAVSGAEGSPDQPFASVLQQKVQDTAAKDAATGNNAPPAHQEGAPAQNQTQNQTKAQDAKQAEDGAAKPAETAKSEQATDPKDASAPADANAMLQTLLPWMASLQAAQAHASANVATAADDKEGVDAAIATLTGDAVPTALPMLPQGAVVAVSAGKNAQDDASGKGPALQLDVGSGNRQTAAADETIATAANLAVSADAAAVQAKSADTHGAITSFDAALGAARDQMAATQTHAAGAAAHTAEPARLNAPLGSDRWQNELGDQVRWMSNNDQSKAELILTPPSLGRIEISLNISGDQANAMFVSANPQVRDALEASMDRLRDVLAQSGISLGQTQVGAESFSQAAGQQGSGSGSSSRDGGANLSAEAGNTVNPANWTRSSNNMLDVFA